MPYNYKGDLYKREIVKKLQDVGLDRYQARAASSFPGIST